VSLAAGTFTHATITVNAQGCITAIGNGEPELYTPDDCCGSGTDGTGGTVGPRGPKGDPGVAATIAVEQIIGTGTTWSVENTGTTTAAIFKFTAPATTTGGSGATSGYTGDVNGVVVEAGLVKSMPLSLVTNIEALAGGNKASLISIMSVPNLAGKHTLTLNLDQFYTDLDSKFQTLHTSQQATIDNLTAAVADLLNTVTTLQGTLGTQQNSIAELTNELGDLRAEFNAYVAAHP
jgi:flagellin-like hook-associated protein FlgL